MDGSCDACIFCRIAKLEKRVEDLADTEEVRVIREEISQLKLDVEILKARKSENNH